MNENIKQTERGWAGHFCGAMNCKFRRNTLLEHNEIKIVVSSVGLWIDPENRNGYIPVWDNKHYFETKAFYANLEDTRYYDISNNEISIKSEHYIDEIDADDRANIMHDHIVEEIKQRMIENTI
jgi:hypothetical protein